MSSLGRLVLVTLLALSMQSCCTRRMIERERVSENSAQQQMSHDTLYLAQLRYDSIFVERDRTIDRTTDTIRIVDRQTEYRFRLVHDTTYIAHTDTLIQKDTLQVKDSIVVNTSPQVLRNKCATKQMSLGQSLIKGGWERVCSWFDYLAYCSLFLVIALIIIKIK